MRISEIRAALTALVRGRWADVPVIKTDSRKPVVRPSFRIDVLPVSGGAACDGAREREADIDIWYYPKNADAPRDACDAVADGLLDLLGEGFEVGGVWIPLDEEMTCDSSEDVLVCQCSITWIESAAEEGEPMEELNYNETERS